MTTPTQNTHSMLTATAASSWCVLSATGLALAGYPLVRVEGSFAAIRQENAKDPKVRRPE